MTDNASSSIEDYPLGRFDAKVACIREKFKAIAEHIDALSNESHSRVEAMTETLNAIETMINVESRSPRPQLRQTSNNEPSSGPLTHLQTHLTAL